jgi:D-arginine dehydrogenase
LFSEIYGGETVRALSRGSREFLYSPPPGFAESALVRPRDTLHIATAEQEERLDEFANLPDVAAAIRG